MRSRLFLTLLLFAAVPLGGCQSLSALSSRPQGAIAAGPEFPKPDRLDPARSRTLYLSVIEELREGGKPHAALAYLNDYDRRWKNDAKAQLLRADCLLDIAAYDQAEAIYRAHLNGPLAAAAHAGLGHVAAGRGDWANAVAAFRAAVERDPINYKYLNALGYAELKTHDYRPAVFTLRQAWELAPDNTTIRNNVLIALKASGQMEEVRAILADIGSEADRREAERLLASGAGV